MQLVALLVALALLMTRNCCAQVNATTDESQWQSAVGSYTTITFTEFAEFTTITDQYARLGIHFTDGNDFIFVSSSFPTDDHGLVSSDGFGNLGMIHMSFSHPRTALALEFTGDMQVSLYSQGKLFFTSDVYVAAFTPFVGFISTTPFDAAVIMDPNDDIMTVDNLYFGSPIPAPGSLALFGLAAAFVRRRGRCRQTLVRESLTVSCALTACRGELTPPSSSTVRA